MTYLSVLALASRACSMGSMRLAIWSNCCSSLLHYEHELIWLWLIFDFTIVLISYIFVSSVFLVDCRFSRCSSRSALVSISDGLVDLWEDRSKVWSSSLRPPMFLQNFFFLGNVMTYRSSVRFREKVLSAYNHCTLLNGDSALNLYFFFSSYTSMKSVSFKFMGYTKTPLRDSFRPCFP